MIKKILATVLALVMAFGVLTMNAFAAKDVVYGDVTADTKINANDALTVLQIATGLNTTNAYKDAIADVNADGRVNSNDALIILQFATGLKDDFGKSYDKTKKAKTVDPIFADGKYTFTLTLSDESVDDLDVVFSTDGESKVMSSTMVISAIPVEYRLLHKNGKNYQIVPTVKLGVVTAFQGVYSETDEDISSVFETYEKIFKAEVIYSSTSKKTISGTSYDCETFCTENNAILEYCYYDGALEYIIITSGSSTQTLDISNLVDGAVASMLEIPSDCVKDDTAFQS